MNICWIVNSGALYVKNGSWTSSMASNRYRVLMPTNELMKKGHRVSIGVNSIKIIDDLATLAASDVVVFGKSFDDGHIRIAQLAKEAGVKVVVDICDIHFFSEPDMYEHYKQLLALCDCVVVNSMAMAKAMANETDKPIEVIADPYEGKKQEPRFKPDSQQLKLAWFGYSRNILSLLDAIPMLGTLANSIPICLKVVTNGDESFEADIEKFNNRYQGIFRMEYYPWSIETTEKILDESDIVVIPNKMVDDGLVKSSNRIIESIIAGRFVVANPIPSYREFGRWAYVGDNLVEGIRWALQNPETVVKKIREGQDYIEKNYSAEMIAAKWETLLSRIADSKSFNKPAVNEIPKQIIRLNLGCGDKILPGYVNVDIVSSRAGKQPDAICDLKDLKIFENNYADEILSVHVIEHFWRWEVEAVLQEWVRVLKPGGTLILECPNLISACEEFLKNPDVAASGGAEGQRSMWVFYGDPKWQDPLMVHRWGYTPNSLAALLASIGLVNIRQEPAQFKLREPRDMRIVAFKPH